MPTARLETFSDGVFAIAATLLILNVEVSHHGSLGHDLVHIWPAYAAYAVSFLVIGVIWVNHHTVLQVVERAGRSPFDHRAESVAPCVEGQDLVDALPARLRPEIADLGQEREERCRGELPGHVCARCLRAAPRGRP